MEVPFSNMALQPQDMKNAQARKVKPQYFHLSVSIQGTKNALNISEMNTSGIIVMHDCCIIVVLGISGKCVAPF